MPGGRPQMTDKPLCKTVKFACPVSGCSSEPKTKSNLKRHFECYTEFDENGNPVSEVSEHFKKLSGLKKLHTVYFLSLKHTFSNLPKGKVVGEKTIDMEEVGDNKQWVDVWVHYGNFTSFMADIIASIQEDQWLLPHQWNRLRRFHVSEAESQPRDWISAEVERWSHSHKALSSWIIFIYNVLVSITSSCSSFHQRVQSKFINI